MSRKQILVTLDGSETSKQILPVVRQLFQPAQAEFTFLRIAQPIAEPSAHMYVQAPHVVPDFQAREWDRNLAQKEWQAYFHAVENELVAEAEPFRRDDYIVHTRVEVGTPIAGITNYLQEYKPDLLAMATHGRRGLSKLLLGSVAETILHNISTPILLKRPVESITD